MKSFFTLITCFFFAFAQGKDTTFSPNRLKGFYEELVCEGKQDLAYANLAGGCFSFWVSLSGSDSNPGTEKLPFLTLERARDAVAALPSEAFKDLDVYIYIADGTYRLSQPFVLTSSNSGKRGHDVVYTAAPGAHPVISGGVPITGWSLFDAGLGIYRAPAPYTSRQLYVNGTRAQRARTSSYPPAFNPQWTVGGGGGIQFGTTTPETPDPTTWTNQSNIEAVILTQWRMMRIPIQSVLPPPDPIYGLITIQQPAWNNANVNFDIMTDAPGIWSFWEATWFENAYEFLTTPGQWYLDQSAGYVYYIPLPGEDITTADVELPILETLVEGQGTLSNPVHNIRFEGLTFSYATWLLPSGPNGYIADQSGQLLIGPDHELNYIGHDQNVVPTPGNLPFNFASNIVFYGNIFEHLGAVGIQFGPGSTNNRVDSNLFTDISSSAIELGAATSLDAHPTDPAYLLQNNLITNNLISGVAVEYQDAAGIFVGFTQGTTISNNTIVNVPWSGIAMGWGWGLLDEGSFPGLPNAYSGEWGMFTSPTPNSGNKILQNNFVNFLNVLWDGGAIYTTGQQGPSPSQGLLIQGNVASGKMTSGPGGVFFGAGNTFYTDGGSRYITLESNASYNNPIGVTFFGLPPTRAPEYTDYAILNGVRYGSDSGGCVTYGDIEYLNNYWLEAPIPTDLEGYNVAYYLIKGFFPYLSFGFCDVCPYTNDGVVYPVNLNYVGNVPINSEADIPSSLLSSAGVQSRPPTIPASKWVVPPP